MKILHLLNIFLFLACFSGFTWSICRFFKQCGRKAAGMQIISWCGLTFSLLHIYALILKNHSGIGLSLAGSLFYGLSLLLFWSAVEANRAKPLTLAFTQDQPDHIVTHGPYRWVRHPFYASYISFWLAGVLACSYWPLLISLGIMSGLYFQAAREEERKFTNSSFAQTYRDYQTQAGMFFPKIPAKPGK